MPVTINGTTGIVSPNFIGNGSVPTGSVYHFASSTAPTGFLICNGNAVPNGNGTVQGVTADFSELYAILGTTYGNAGTLPDLRGYFIRGNGTNNDGIASATFGAKQADSLFTATLTQTSAQFVTNAYNVESRGSALSASTLTTNFATAETRPANIALLPCIKY